MNTKWSSVKVVENDSYIISYFGLTNEKKEKVFVCSNSA